MNRSGAIVGKVMAQDGSVLVQSVPGVLVGRINVGGNESGRQS